MRLSLVLLAVALCAATVSALVPIDGPVASALEKGAEIDILVKFPPRQRAPKSVLSKLTRLEKQKLIHAELIATAASSQSELLKDLLSSGFQARTFWLGNTMHIKNATPFLIKTLRERKNIIEIEAVKEVGRVNEPMVHEVFDKLPAHVSTIAKRDVEWNIAIINAEAIWNVTKGYEVTIANIDTGVRYTHESLIRRYRGNRGPDGFDHDYNWHDPNGTPYPFDNNGHGTHTMGSITGDDLVSGIGVAPEALWIAAKGCASSSCSNVDLISSFQYLFAPERQDGSDADVGMAPQVISNSWGGGQGSTTFLPYIEPHVEAGTVVTFSQGNAGSGCGTANSPGDLDVVIGVGSTNSLDQLSSFSSRGPGVNRADFNTQKPDISAPGERVLSSYYTSDTAYATLSGTSMACPHVTGVIALMYDVNPSLSVDDVRSILIETATRGLPAPIGGLTTCSGIPYTQYPNYHYGYGRIDAAAAVNTAIGMNKKQK
jgi:subtilisin family serine protease